MKLRIFGVPDPEKARISASESNHKNSNKTDEDDESERSNPITVLQIPPPTVEVCEASVKTSDVSGISQSTIDESQMKRKSMREKTGE